MLVYHTDSVQQICTVSGGLHMGLQGVQRKFETALADFISGFQVQEPLQCLFKHDSRFRELSEQSDEQLECHLADFEVVTVESTA